MPTINNFAAIRSHLRFDKPGDFYVAHIMIRGKDIPDEQKKIFREDHQSGLLVKTYYADSLAYFDKKKPAMIDLAEKNHARVYIIPTRKNRIVTNRIIAKKVIEYIDDPNVRYDHLIRTAVCGCHISDYKWWVIDIDNDETIYHDGNPVSWPEITLAIKPLVDETKTRSSSEIYMVPTKNGFHLLTPPFNRSKVPWLGDRLKTDGMTLLYYNDGE